MNLYKHHLGDYDGATAHLSWDEDMAYSRLLRVYYRREKPFVDAAEACRLARASSRAQRAAVDSVLQEFFEQRSDGWHNKRCDEEIQLYREEGEEGQAKKDNERERQRRYRERRRQLFDALREHGIVPKWDTPLEQVQTMLDDVTKREHERSSNGPVTRTATAVPITNNQEPITSTKSKALSDSAEKPPNADPVQQGKNGKAYLAEARDVLTYLNEVSGHHFREVEANIDPIVARLKEGYSAARLREITFYKAKEWGADEKMAEFVRPKTLYTRTNCGNYDGVLPNGVDSAGRE